jgi:hypothetical protein
MLVRVSDNEYWAVAQPLTTGLLSIGKVASASSILLHEVNGVWSEY